MDELIYLPENGYIVPRSLENNIEVVYNNKLTNKLISIQAYKVNIVVFFVRFKFQCYRIGCHVLKINKIM